MVAACSSPDTRSLRIRIDSAAGYDVLVDGLSRDDTGRVRVSVAGDTTRIAGRFTLADSGLRFRPVFPFDAGRDYEVAVNGRSVVKQFRLPASDGKPSTYVTRIYPTIDTLPENQLRFYVEFSAPMSRESGVPYVKLVDDGGAEVKYAFLPLDADFWNHDRTRYTLFLDPGRVKRGILPNDQMGRALVAGRTYSIVVDSTWRDGLGRPLVAPHAKRFVAGQADYQSIVLDRWRLQLPPAGTRQPLVMNFGEPLDHGLLQRAVGVEYQTRLAVDGTIDVGGGGRYLRFTPAAPWPKGLYQVIVLDFLEDLAGNRVNRAFEVDLFQRADTSAVPSRHIIRFRLR